ncbi:MAG: hypothetical protein GDA39_10635 [Hyphomonadaceae bacterium]|nr:hypothetical protein [Hyphomonadaceae bacterium]MBC6413275.1 hypothetical protein [Hyphomonadaceae bacterium]
MGTDFSPAARRTFGYKGFWRSDGGACAVPVPAARPLNEGEAPHLPHLLKAANRIDLVAE